MTIELLAPAGDLERAKIALDYGADAVYVGGRRFSLRARASNFELQDIAELVEYAHKDDHKVYVTVNMIPHEDDMEGLREYLIDLNMIHVDAIIVASLYIASLSKEVAPTIQVFLSTQLSITNSKTMDYFKQFKIDRVVLARELNMHQIETVISESSLPIEVFIHGGMCVNYSGRCTLSNEMTLRDANRGGCAQSCRWNYSVYYKDSLVSDKDPLFTMGSKDLLTLNHIADFIKLGVCSLKIEGRMKSAYYIAVIVKVYRTLIDAVYENKLSDDLIDRLNLELKQAESRATFDGFLSALPNQNGQIYQVNAEGVSQQFIGMIKATKPGWALVEMRNHLGLNQNLEVFSAHQANLTFINTSMIDENGIELIIANQPLTLVWLKIPFAVSIGDFIRRQGAL